MENNKKVVIGGTFDHFHRGHKELIEKGYNSGEVIIGLTSNEMAKEMKKREIEDFETRKDNLLNYVRSEFNKELKVKKIDDIYGFAVHENLDYIVVSPETEKNAFLINEKRVNLSKNKLEIIKIDFVLAKDGKPISSTRIYNKEIDGEGNILS